MKAVQRILSISYACLTSDACMIMSEKVEWACSDLNVQVVFKYCRTLRSLLMKIPVKKITEMDNVKAVVYKVDCERGYNYVGETGRTMETRMNNNGVAVHANKTLPHS